MTDQPLPKCKLCGVAPWAPSYGNLECNATDCSMVGHYTKDDWRTLMSPTDPDWLRERTFPAEKPQEGVTRVHVRDGGGDWVLIHVIHMSDGHVWRYQTDPGPPPEPAVSEEEVLEAIGKLSSDIMTTQEGRNAAKLLRKWKAQKEGGNS